MGSKMIQLEKLLDIFLMDQKCNGNSQHTISYYKSNIVRFINYLKENYGNSSLQQITLQNLKIYTLHFREITKYDPNREVYTDSPLSSVTIRTYLRAVKTFVSWLGKEDYIDPALASKFKLPKQIKKAVDILSEDEIQKIIIYLKQKKNNKYRDLAIFCCALELGVRLSEIVTMKLTDLKLESSLIKVLGKGNKERYIAYGGNLKKILFKYVYQERPTPFTDKITSLFLKKDEGKEITRNSVIKIFKTIKKATGITKLHPHLLRHTMITMSLARNSNIFALKQKTGHSDFQIMNNYLQIAQGLNLMKDNNVSLLDDLDIK